MRERRCRSALSAGGGARRCPRGSAMGSPSPPRPAPLVRSLPRLVPGASPAAILGAAGGAGGGGRGGTVSGAGPRSASRPSSSSSYAGPSRALRPPQSGARTSGGASRGCALPSPLRAAMPAPAARLLLAALLCGAAAAARGNAAGAGGGDCAAPWRRRGRQSGSPPELRRGRARGRCPWRLAQGRERGGRRASRVGKGRRMELGPG